MYELCARWLCSFLSSMVYSGPCNILLPRGTYKFKVSALAALNLDEIELCGYIGGTCTTECERQLVHRWGYSLCRSSLKCCAYRNVGPSEGVNSCQRNEGTCQAWYRNCTGNASNQYECGHPWQVCCVHSSTQASNTSHHNHTSQTTTQVNSPAVNIPETSTDPPRTDATQCGVPERSRRQKRIVGGNLTTREEWPWHVGVRTALGHRICGAVVIGTNYIITAAHCFKRAHDLAYYRIVTDCIDRHAYKSYPIKRIVKHPLHEEKSQVADTDHGQAHKYDIALVELNESITFSTHIRPVCLPHHAQNFQSRSCWLVGWGSKSGDGLAENEYSLRSVRGQVLQDSECQSLWPGLINSKMLCFGDENKGACQGDSGGGMFCEDSEGKFVLAGVISWGSAQCNQKATVLTNISRYTEWISTHMTSG